MDKCRDNSEGKLTLFRDNFNPAEDIIPFFERLVRGVTCSGQEIDSIIEQYSSNWKISRMSCVDRNIMRIAVYELLWCDDIPAKVSINEAIDIGKKYGTEESGPFINGILDSIRDAIEKEAIKVTDKTVGY
ncbi:MAG: transcription antitermination factor NusB [Desulfobacterales bacterium]|nr:transcription antitermination factor NusB [Desulfobacterales bacterium]